MTDFQPLPLAKVLCEFIEPAYKLLPSSLKSERATVISLTIGQQESKFQYPFQVLSLADLTRKGPARGYWQFEQGTARSRGGVWGVFLHPTSRPLLEQLCIARGVIFAPTQIWRALETDHVLAAGVARLLLATDPRPLPALGNMDAAWDLYAKRTWRPGKPHRNTWDDYYRNALQAVTR